MNRCSGRTWRGLECQRTPMEGRAHCDRHDPEAARKRGRSGSRKGKQRRQAERAVLVEALRVRTLDDVRALLERAAERAERNNDPSTMVRAAQVFADLFERVEMGDRLAELERRLAEVHRDGPSPTTIDPGPRPPRFRRDDNGQEVPE